MKRILNLTLILFSIFLFLDKVEAKKITVKLKKCVDGDTAVFTYKKEDFKARFLAIDTPETKHTTKGKQPWGEEASEYTCKRLESAKKIVLEYDKNSDEKDMYNRHLVWVWLDDKLLQKDIINKGLAKVAYLYGKYSYVDELKESEAKAQKKKVGIWSEESVSSNNSNKEQKVEDNDKYDSILNKLIYNKDGKINYVGFIIAIIIIIILCIFNKNYRKKTISKLKKKL